MKSSKAVTNFLIFLPKIKGIVKNKNIQAALEVVRIVKKKIRAAMNIEMSFLYLKFLFRIINEIENGQINTSHPPK